MEEKVEIHGYYGYYVTKSGKIYSRHNNGKKRLNDYYKELIPKLNVSGYYYIKLGGKSKSLHRIIATVFILNPFLLPQINHKDGNKLNNIIDNLEWCDQSYNMIHAVKIGLKKPLYGLKNPSVKYSEETIKEVRRLRHIKGLTFMEISRKLNISYTHTHRIATGKSRTMP